MNPQTDPPQSPPKKGVLGKIKAGLDDKEEQLALLSTFVRLGVVVWSGFILTLNYVEIPGLGKQDRIDPTFIASVFTGALASFGLETAKKRGDGTYKADQDRKRAEAAAGARYQTIRIETPIKIMGADGKDISVVESKPPYKL